MIPGCGAGKGDSPRAVNQTVYAQNHEYIDWAKGRPKETPWLVTATHYRGDEYAGMNVHERILKTYYKRECSGELGREKEKGEHRMFARAHREAIARGL